MENNTVSKSSSDDERIVKNEVIPYGKGNSLFEKPIQILPNTLGEISTMVQLDIRQMLPDSFWEQFEIDIDSEAVQGMIEAYQKRMHLILRWSNSLEQVDQLESDLQHVGAMLQMVNKIEKTLPHFAASFDLNVLRLLIIIHDIGEGGQGDLPVSALTKKNEKTERDDHKNTELLYGRRFLQQGIPKEVSSRDCIVNLFYAYEFRNSPKLLPDHQRKNNVKNIMKEYPKELHFMKVLDIFQAFFWGEKNFFNNIESPAELSKKVLQPSVFQTAFDKLWKEFSKKSDKLSQYQLLDMAEVFFSQMHRYNNASDIQANLEQKKQGLKSKKESDIEGEFTYKNQNPKKKTKLKKQKNIDLLKRIIEEKRSLLQNMESDNEEERVKTYLDVHALLNTAEKFLQKFSEKDCYEKKLLEFSFYIKGQRSLLQKFYFSEITAAASIDASLKEYKDFLKNIPLSKEK